MKKVIITILAFVVSTISYSQSQGQCSEYTDSERIQNVSLKCAHSHSKDSLSHSNCSVGTQIIESPLSSTSSAVGTWKKVEVKAKCSKCSCKVYRGYYNREIHKYRGDCESIVGLGHCNESPSKHGLPEK